MAENHQISIPPGISIPDSRLYLSSIPASLHQKLPNPVSRQTYCGHSVDSAMQAWYTEPAPRMFRSLTACPFLNISI